MQLFLEASPSAFAPWEGEPINGIRYPRSISNWSPEDLAAIGLYVPKPADPVPEGKVVTGQSVQRVDGVVKWIHTLEDARPPSITADEVIAERERRLAQGFDYDFGDTRGVHHIGTTAEDMRRWLDEVTPISQVLINAGLPTGEITILTNTGPTTVTASEWQQILLAAGTWRQPAYQASFALMEMDPIPVDYTDDRYWP